MEKIVLAVDRHRAGITALKRIAGCCLKEADTWASSVTALHKARQEEEKAVQRVKEQEKKQEEKRIAREKSKQVREQKREATKEAKAAAAAAASAADQCLDDGAGVAKAKKRRRTGGQEDLSDQDPKILHEMSKFAGGSMGVVDSFDEFTKLIVNAPDSACCLRLKKASFKKAMTALRWHSVCQCVLIGFHRVTFRMLCQ